MNKIRVKIENIKKDNELHLVRAVSSKIPFNIVTLKLNEKINNEKKVNIYFKESEVIICRNKNPLLSIENAVKCNIIDIEIGDLMSNIKMISACGLITSLISTKWAERLNLKIMDKVLAMIKANSISIGVDGE